MTANKAFAAYFPPNLVFPYLVSRSQGDAVCVSNYACPVKERLWHKSALGHSLIC